MKKTYVIFLLLVSVILCGCNTVEKPESPNAGLWLGHSISYWGKQEPMETYFPGGMKIELMSGGKGFVHENDSQDEARWTLSDGHFTIRWNDQSFSGMLEGNKIVLEDFQGIGSNAIFYKEGTEIPDIVVLPEKPEPVVTSSEPEEIQTPVSEGESAVSLLSGTVWEGFITNSNRSGNFLYPEESDVVAYIDVDSVTGRPFFDIYPVDNTEYAIVSMFIEHSSDISFKAVIGDQDAWIYNHYLLPEEGRFFTDIC